MNSNLLAQPRRWVLVLTTAFVLAVTTASASIWLDNLTGASLTPAVFACQHQGGGCG